MLQVCGRVDNITLLLLLPTELEGTAPVSVAVEMTTFEVRVELFPKPCGLVDS